MRKLIPILLMALTSTAFAQSETQTNAESGEATVNNDVEVNTDGLVTIASRGGSVRNVLFDLFDQTKHNFVLEPNIHFILYMSLAGVEFEEALNIVTNVANLEYEIDNGIYFIGKKKVGPTIILTPKPAIPPINATRGKLTTAELSKRVTTRFTMTSLSEVFTAFTKQTGVEIIMDKNVPMYRIDAFLIDTSLKYALTVVARAAGLTYTLTNDKQIRISKKK